MTDLTEQLSLVLDSEDALRACHEAMRLLNEGATTIDASIVRRLLGSGYIARWP